MNQEHFNLYKDYLDLQSKEIKDTVIGYDPFIEPGTTAAIKINFKDGSWIRAYRNKNGELEWY